MGEQGRQREERKTTHADKFRSCERHAPVCLCVDVCTYIRIYNKAHRCCRHTGKRSTACVAAHTGHTTAKNAKQTRCSHVLTPSPPPSIRPYILPPSIVATSRTHLAPFHSACGGSGSPGLPHRVAVLHRPPPPVLCRMTNTSHAHKAACRVGEKQRTSRAAGPRK